MRIYTVATQQGKERVSYESGAKSYAEARSFYSQLLELGSKLDEADRSSDTTKVAYSHQIGLHRCSLPIMSPFYFLV